MSNIEIFGVEELNNALDLIVAETPQTANKLITKTAQSITKGAIRATRKAKAKDIKGANAEEIKRRKQSIGHAKAGWAKAWTRLGMSGNAGIPKKAKAKYFEQGIFIDKRFEKQYPSVTIGNKVWYVLMPKLGLMKKLNNIVKRGTNKMVRDAEKEYHKVLKKHLK